MSLIGFHKVLIGVAILFCAGFAAWTLLAPPGAGSGTRLVVAAAFALCAVTLGVYLRHLDRYLGRDEEAGSGSPG